MDNYISQLSGQIAISFAQQVDRHLEQFLKKNLIPFDGDIAKTMEQLEAKGMMLIKSDEPLDVFGDRITKYSLVKILDSTTITLKSPTYSVKDTK